MKWLAIIIILSILCITLVIFAPGNYAFYSADEFSELHFLTSPMMFKTILSEVKNIPEDKFMDYPDKNMWYFNKCSKYEVLPLYMLDNLYEENIKLVPSLFNALQHIESINTIAVIKLSGESILKIHQEWADLSNNTLRCLLGVLVPCNDVNKCGVMVEGDARKIEDGKILVYDTSRKHSIYNRHKKDCYYVMIDMDRKNKKGLSEYKMKKSVLEYMTPKKEEDLISLE